MSCHRIHRRRVPISVRDNFLKHKVVSPHNDPHDLLLEYMESSLVKLATKDMPSAPAREEHYSRENTKTPNC